MKNFLLLTLILLSSVSSSRLRADEPAGANRSADRMFDAYVQYMEAEDWEMAEVIALGAKAKFGEQHQVVRRMLSEVAKATSAELQAQPQSIFLPLKPTARSLPDRIYVTKFVTYPLADQVMVAGWQNMDHFDAIVVELKAEIAKQDWCNDEINVSPFRTGLSLIVNATAERHAFVQEYLAKLPRAKQIQASKIRE